MVGLDGEDVIDLGGFCKNLQDAGIHLKVTRSSRDLISKPSQHSTHGTGGHCRPKFRRFWPRESTGSGGKEKGEGGGSIPCLTHSGGAPRRSNFVRERGNIRSDLFLRSVHGDSMQ
jgi:hypothetical protein